MAAFDGCAKGKIKEGGSVSVPYDLPLILLARLAVDKRFSGRGLGHALISEALKITLHEVGCRCVITDAYRDEASMVCALWLPSTERRCRWRPAKNVSRCADHPRRGNRIFYC